MPSQFKRIRIVRQDGTDGPWLRSYSDTLDGRGFLLTTKKKNEAMTFKDAAEAFNFYRQQSKAVPLRTDGKPNRPLTAYTLNIE